MITRTNIHECYIDFSHIITSFTDGGSATRSVLQAAGEGTSFGAAAAAGRSQRDSEVGVSTIHVNQHT